MDFLKGDDWNVNKISHCGTRSTWVRCTLGSKLVLPLSVRRS